MHGGTMCVLHMRLCMHGNFTHEVGTMGNNYILAASFVRETGDHFSLRFLETIIWYDENRMQVQLSQTILLCAYVVHVSFR